jgi:hypothetical protein
LAGKLTREADVNAKATAADRKQNPIVGASLSSGSVATTVQRWRISP